MRIGAFPPCRYHAERCQIRLLRKGKRERVALDIGGETCVALNLWLALRGQYAADGLTAVFVGLAYNERGKALAPGAFGPS